ncbi:MAG: carboxypeptidase regulatory-like domain-containing protein, partial [Gemmatimonadetes bacterium]|nr:carboxypeptidase regulatory-like domain-containing protein [Gemmatimonadota bacterium]
MYSFRSIFPVLLFFLVIFQTGCGESPTGGSTETTGKVQGRVVSSADPGSAIAGATVRIEGTDMTAVTAEDGSFTFDGVTDGDVRIVIDAPAGSGYESSEVEVSVHGGGTVDLDVAVLPQDLRPDRIQLYPAEARLGILDETRFWVNVWADWLGEDGQGPGDPGDGVDVDGDHEGEDDFVPPRGDNEETTDEFVPPRGEDGEIGAEKSGDYPYLRPTWSIKSDTPIGVISREGTFIGTAVGRGTIVATFATDLVATATVEVVADGDVVRVQMAPGYWLSIQSGAEQYMGAYAVTGRGTLLEDPAIDWSLDPQTLGTLEPVTGLTAEEEAEIVRSLPFYHEYIDYGWPDGPLTDEWYPEYPREDLIGKVSLAKFTAAEPPDERAAGVVRAALGDVHADTEVHVRRRGVLERAYIAPDEIHVRRDSRIFFSAAGLNEFGYALEGLTFEWRVEPEGFGVFADFDDPDKPGGHDDGFPPHDGTDIGPDGTNHEDHGGMGMDDDEPIRPPFEVESFRIFSPEQTGEGEIIVTVTDPVSAVSIEARAHVFVEAPPRLIDVIVEPEIIEVERGHEIPVHAFAIAEDGDVVTHVKFEWILSSPSLGDFYDGPREPDYDSTLAGDDGEHPGRPDGSDDEFGFSMRIFHAADTPGEGSIIVEAHTENGDAVRREVP